MSVSEEQELVKSPTSPGKKLLRSVKNQTAPVCNDTQELNLSLRHIDLAAPSVLPAIICQCGTRSNNVHSLDISYSITNQSTIKVLCSYLPRLQNLVAVQCGLSDIAEDTEWPKCLKAINLSRNKLTRFPPGLNCLLELTELNLSGNAITELDSNLLQLPKLKKVHILNNPVQNVPKSVCREGVVGLRTFFNVTPLSISLIDKEQEIHSLPFSTNDIDRCLDLRRYVLHKQGSVESGYESSRQRAISDSTSCSASELSDKETVMADTEEEWPIFGLQSLPKGYSEAGRSQLCQVYLPDGCTDDIQIEIIKDLSLYPKVQPGELLITPVVRITPHGIVFPKDKPAIIALAHCTKPNGCGSLNLVPLCSSTSILQNSQWGPLATCNSCEIFQNCVTFSTTHFSLFAVSASIPYPSTSLTVTPDAGGQLEIADLPGFKITIPAKSVLSPNTIKATMYFLDHPYAINNHENASASTCVGLEPHGLQFETPVKVSIPIPDYEEIRHSFPDSSLLLYHAPSNTNEQGNLEWKLIENQNTLISQKNGIIIATFTTTHFSFYEFLWSVKDTISLGASNIYKHIFGRDHFVSVRCQAFMSPPLNDLTFGMVVCVYKFGDPLTEISNYPWLVADSGEKQTFLKVGDLHVSLEGCFTGRTDLGECLVRDVAIIDFKGEDFCTRFEFALKMNDTVRTPGQVLGKLRFKQLNGNSPVYTDYNLKMPASLGETKSRCRFSTSSMNNQECYHSDLTPPWSPDSDIPMDCNNVFDNPVSPGYTSTRSNGAHEAHNSTQSQPKLTRGKHKRKDSFHSSNGMTLYNCSSTRAKRRLFLRKDDITDRTLIDISHEACSKYIDLGIQLGLSYNSIQSTVGAVAANKQEHLKTFYILQDWKARAGSDFTFTVLARALEDVGLTTVAQNFCYAEE